MPSRLYSASELAEIPWPNTTDGHYARDYLGAMMQHGTARYIKNVDADVYALIIDDIALPVISPRTGPTNCYVCSPTEHYIAYARFEAEALENAPLRSALRFVFRLLSIWIRITDIERVVYVNNWFLSTNLYPPLTTIQIAEITELVVKTFPDRVVIMRSLNNYTNRALIEGLEDLRYQRIVSRQVYITDPSDPNYRTKRDFKADTGLLRRTTYQSLQGRGLSESDMPRLVELYNDLYLNKYTDLNPQFSTEFMKMAIDLDLMTIIALNDGRSIDAVLGYFRRDNQMTTPIFGYDTARPRSDGLYRLLSALIVLESEKHGCVLNQSSGASTFKIGRGCSPHIEYSLFYSSHTSMRQRLGWCLLRRLVNSVAEPIMKRYQL